MCSPAPVVGCAVGVEGSRSPGRIAVAERQSPELLETAHGDRIDEGIGSTRNHDLSVAPTDGFHRESQRIDTGGASRCHSQGGSLGPESNTHVDGGGVDDDHRNYHGTHPPWPLRVEMTLLALICPHSTRRRADVNPDLRSQSGRDLQSGLAPRFVGSRNVAGMIGLQNHQDYNDSVVSYRNIRVLELPDDATAYHVLEHAGWKMCGPGAFGRAGNVVTSAGGMGMLWHEKPFEDFLLLLDWRVGREQDNSGVFVRFPDPGDDPWVAVRQGYELQICDAAEPKHRTGSVYSFKGASSVPTKPVGEGNHYAIEVRGQRYRVRVNGVLVTEFTGDRSQAGHIGLQNHDPDSRVSFKNIRVVELSK